MDFVAFLVFFLALAWSILIHELGHFLAARAAKIEVEEFGFGLPPRAFGVWRNKGYFFLNKERIEIPNNFDLKLDWEQVESKPVSISVDRLDDKLVLRSLAYEETQKLSSAGFFESKEVLLDEDGKPVKTEQEVKKTLQFGKSQGEIKMDGFIRDLHPGTLFSVNWIPLGGFVRPKGEGDPNQPGGLAAANPWKRLGVLFAGPIMNLLTAVVVFALIIGMSGVVVPGQVFIGGVEEQSPADQAGFITGDTIVSINGVPVANILEVRGEVLSNLDREIPVVVERNGVEETLFVTPLSNRGENQGAMGVLLEMPTRPASLGEALAGGATLTGTQAVMILSIPVMLIEGIIAPDEARLVGLVGMYDMFSQAVERDTETRQQAAQASTTGESAPLPSNYTLSLLAMLSVSLGVFNLLPIPALDGGRILFTLPEILFKRRIPYRFENIVNGVAFLLLIGLMLFVNLMDIINPSNFRLP
jgi:regulator of sigma E protease